MINMNLTLEEADLVEAIKNYRRSFPNGHPQLLYYAQQLFDILTDMP